MRFLLFISLLLLAACGQEEPEIVPEDLIIKPAEFSELPNWGRDDYTQIVPAMVRSCGRILGRNPAQKFGPLKEAGSYEAWQKICEDFALVAMEDSQALQEFFESRFRPYAVYAGENPEGLFTGYYEASLRGSLKRSEVYKYPLHKRPDDLIMVQLGDFREDLKGRRIAGRVVGGNLKPYETREDIVNGNWPHDDEVLVWVDNPVDAFFVQIQGSGIVTLDNGSTMRIGYAGQNGHPYYAIGRELIERDALTKESVSMQSIRRWLDENPDQADEIMNTNKSYVFFRALEGEGPLGGEGVALTPLRSLAIDRSLLPYGMPLWVDIAEPVEGHGRINHMMMAQDTGGAIRGPVRGDVFWGYGQEAEYLAGHMKSRGRYWIFLPRAITSN
ncbi:MAG: murein transglycosylase A [Alphaproteobacteria bacterium]